MNLVSCLCPCPCWTSDSSLADSGVTSEGLAQVVQVHILRIVVVCSQHSPLLHRHYSHNTLSNVHSDTGGVPVELGSHPAQSWA